MKNQTKEDNRYNTNFWWRKVKITCPVCDSNPQPVSEIIQLPDNDYQIVGTSDKTKGTYGINVHCPVCHYPIFVPRPK
jgi:hypothetical protein